MISKEKINSFEDLIVWQKAIDLSVSVYKVTAEFPPSEIFGLTSQMRKASNSVSLNISEGSSRTTQSFINHLVIAKGSASEVLSAALLSVKLGFMAQEDLQLVRNKVDEVKKMLNSLIKSLENKN